MQQCICAQVVVTDVEECLEALHENVAANLPKHCTLRPDIWKQPDTTGSEASPSSQQQSDAHPQDDQQPASHASASQHDAAPPASNLNGISLDTASPSSRQDPNAQQALTEVSVADLDWAQDPAFLSPPFEVVLIADVVSCAVPILFLHLLHWLDTCAT